MRSLCSANQLFLSVWLVAATALPADAQNDVLLASGDSVAFSVLGAPDLGRQATIGPDGAVYLPLAGKVIAAGLSVDELREKVYSALRDRAYRISGPGGEDVWRRLQEDELFLDIAEYRPVYVTGDVNNSGEVRYRPGMSVRQALAIAGGVGRMLQEDSEQQILRLIGERDLLLGKIDIQSTELSRLKADLEAVLAVRSAVKDDGVSKQPKGISSRDRLQELAGRWLEARSQLRNSAESTNKLINTQMESRLEVLEELAAASRENLQFEEEDFARTEEAASFRPSPENLRAAADARRDLLQSSTRALETASELLRLKLDMARFSEEAQANISGEQVRLLEALSNGTANMQNMERQLRAIDSQLVALGLTSVGDREASIEMNLFRAGSLATAGEAATPDMVMAPGDVLNVTLAPTHSPSSVR